MTLGNPWRNGHGPAAAERILRAACGPRIRSSFPLAPLTSFRLGGPAALYLEAESEADLAAASEAVQATGIPWAVIGKGSNLLVSDRGFTGLVIRLGKGFRWAAREGSHLHAGGSMPLPALSGVALAHSLAGLEFGVAIPASMGGAVRMNAGAHGRSMSEVWPCPCNSTPMTWRVEASCGTTSPIASTVMKPPGSSTSGLPVPCIS